MKNKTINKSNKQISQLKSYLKKVRFESSFKRSKN